MSTTETRTGCFQMSSEEYHADTSSWSRTMIATFRSRRSVCYARYVVGSAPPEQPKKEAEIGDLAHAALLQPHLLESGQYVAYPPEILGSNGAVSTKDAKAFRDRHRTAGKVVLKLEDFSAVASMVKSVQTKCGPLLTSDAKIEQSIYWVDDTGIVCRCRPDVLVIRDEPICIDIKSTADVSPAEFKRRIEGNGYLLQDAHYSEGVRAEFGSSPRFLFVAVETEWPFACAVYEIDAGDRMAGIERRHETMTQIADCIDTGNWSDDWENNVNILKLNRWALEQA